MKHCLLLFLFTLNMVNSTSIKIYIQTYDKVCRDIFFGVDWYTKHVRTYKKVKTPLD